MKKRRQFGPDLKARVAIEAIRGVSSVTEIGKRFSVHPNLIGQWKKHAIECLSDVFSNPKDRGAGEREQLEAELYQQIGQLKVELDWLKKKSGLLDRGRA